MAEDIEQIEAFGIATIAKIDEEQRNLFGWAYISQKPGAAADEFVVDKQGDFMRPETLEKTAYDYVQHSRAGDFMHLEVPMSDMIESVIFTPDKIEKMGLDPATTPVGWWVGLHFPDPKAWEIAKHLPMFSIGGKGRRVKVKVNAAS